MSEVSLRICAAGHCRQFEHAVLRTWRPRVITFPAMFAVIVHPREGAFLFDTGYARRFFEATRPFPERLYAWTTPVTLGPDESAEAQLSAMGYTAGDVRGIIVSHFHGDHVAGLIDFPRSRIRCLDAAWRAVEPLGRVAGVRHGFLRSLVPSDISRRLDVFDALGLAPLPADCHPFTHGYDLFGDRSVLAVELAGHVRGQCGLFVQGDDGHRYFLVADACWTRTSWQRQRRPSWVAQALFDDRVAYIRTLARVGQVARTAPDTIIVPSHCAETIAELRWRALP